MEWQMKYDIEAGWYGKNLNDGRCNATNESGMEYRVQPNEMKIGKMNIGQCYKWKVKLSVCVYVYVYMCVFIYVYCIINWCSNRMLHPVKHVITVCLFQSYVLL